MKSHYTESDESKSTAFPTISFRPILILPSLLCLGLPTGLYPGFSTILSHSLGSIFFFQGVYGCIPFNTVIYIFLMLCLCIRIVCLFIFTVPAGTLRLP